LRTEKKQPRLPQIRRLSTGMFLRCFAAFFGVLLLVLILIFVLAGRNDFRDWQNNCQESADALIAAADEKLSSFAASGFSILDSVWYNQYKYDIRVSNYEFDYFRRYEICNELNARLLSMDCVQDIVIYMPGHNTVINTVSWYTTEEFQTRSTSLALENGLQVRPECTDTVWRMLLTDNANATDPCYIAIVIDRAKFSSWLSTRCASGITGFRLQSDEAILCDTQDSSGVCHTDTIYSYPSLDAAIYFHSFSDSVGTRMLYNFVLWAIILLLSAALAAGIFTTVSAKPLNRILSRFRDMEFRTTSDAYSYIDGYIDRLDQDNREIQEYNHRLREDMNQFARTMQDEILLLLITHPGEVDVRYLDTQLPWLEEGLPYAMLYLCSESAEAIPIPKVSCAHSCRFSIPEHEQCAIFWFCDPEQAETELRHLTQFAQMLVLPPSFCCVSAVCSDPAAITDLFFELRQRIRLRRREVTELPARLELELITKLQLGDADACIGFLNRYADTFLPEAFVSTLSHVAAEYNMEPDAQVLRASRSADREEACAVLEALTRQICSRRSEEKRKQTSSTVQLIKAYIDRNYANHNLSLKLLQEVFDLNIVFISKAFKEETGVTFSAYLLGLRMDAARQMLADRSVAISHIADQVGYENYVTFKRAFVRFFGVSPTAFRDGQTKTAQRDAPDDTAQEVPETHPGVKQ